jgi:hypothetical protein
MSVVGGSASTGLVQRVQNILLKPAAEWEVIAGEPATTQGLFMGYACILAVLPLIGTLVGRVLFGSMFGGGLGMMAALVGGIVLGIVGYVLNLVLVFVVGLIINALAPSFDAQSDSIQAMKVSVYAGTALWVAGIISWFPVIGWLIGLGALGYTCYLLYLGVSRVMKPPADKAVIYTVVIIGAQILLYLIVGWIMLMVGAMAVVGAAVTGAAAAGAQ